MVVLVEVDEARFVVHGFRRVHLAIAADDDAVTGLGAVRRGAVDGDDARARFGPHGIGGEALAVGDVVDLDLLVVEHAGGLQQLAVDGAGAFVIELRMSHAGTVEFRLEEGHLHGDSAEWMSAWGYFSRRSRVGSRRPCAPRARARPGLRCR